MTALIQYQAIRAAIAEAMRTDEILSLLDEFELVKLRAQQIKDKALLADAIEYEMRAERRLGEVIVAAKEAGLFRQGRQPKGEKNPDEDFLKRPTLTEAGIDTKLSSRAQDRASVPADQFEADIAAVRERVASDGAKVINGARAIMGSRQEPDDSLDYFPTPPWATRALLSEALPTLGFVARYTASVWEPACGEGHIAEVLREYFGDVIATDIHDYGYGDRTFDFLGNDDFPCDWIITNPPFGDKTEQFVLRAFDLAKRGVAMFVRLQWLESVGRYEAIFRDHPPTQIAFFAERVNLCKGRWEPEGTTATAYIWLVWIKGQQPRAPFWIPPGQREALTRPGDAERFTAHPVIKKQHENTGESPLPVSEPAPSTPIPTGAGSLLSEAAE